MKLFSPLLPLIIFSILLAAYGQNNSTNSTSTSASSISTPASSTSTPASSTSTSASNISTTANSTSTSTSSISSSASSTSSPTNAAVPYDVTQNFCNLSPESINLTRQDGSCPSDSKILNIAEYFNQCDYNDTLMCIWNPFVIDIKHENTMIKGLYCPKTGYCGMGGAMFERCDGFIPCQSWLDCNATFKTCIQTKALIISPILIAIIIALGTYTIIVIRKKIKYNNQLRLNDDDGDDEGSAYFHDNSSVIDAVNSSIPLPRLSYKPDGRALDDMSIGMEDYIQRNKGGLHTDDLMFFGDEAK